MVNNENDLDLIFQALADPTRRAMLGALKTSPLTVGSLAAPHDMSLAGVSKHLGVLEKAGLVRRERQGREVRCTLETPALQAAETWLQAYAALWHERLDRLDELLTAELDHDR